MRAITKICTSVFFLVSTIACSGAITTQRSKEERTNVSQSSQEAILENLRLALAPGARAVRIYFNAACDLDDAGDLLFPVVNVQPPVNRGHGLESVKSMFRNDSNVAVSENGVGIIKITIGSVSGRILQTEIPLLKLDQRAQYNPGGLEGAIPAIERAPEFLVASEKLKASQVSYFSIGGFEPALEALPHLPATMQNVTVEQALDSVAETFGGAVIYGECNKPSGESLIDIWFYKLK